MNAFEELVRKLEALSANAPGLSLHVDEPLHATGHWIATLATPGDYRLEVQWNRHLGFGLVAGDELEFGTGVHEMLASAEQAFERVKALIAERAPTRVAPVALAELRKLEGVLQKDVACRLGLSKSALNQVEAGSVAGMQVATLKKVIQALGGELVVTARFPEGRERQVALD